MNVNRVWHLMCNHRKPRIRKKNRKRYLRWLLNKASTVVRNRRANDE